MRQQFFDRPEDDLPEREPGEDNNCTTELLLAFVTDHMTAHGDRMPTWGDVRLRFRARLGPLVCAWELMRQGRWPGRLIDVAPMTMAEYVSRVRREGR